MSTWQKHGTRLLIAIAIIVLLLHIGFFVLLLLFGGRSGGGSGDGSPIPVQLVMLPPDQKKPEEKKEEEKKQPEQKQQKQQDQKPPPHGPLASDELGDPDATGKVATTHAPEAGEIQPQEGEAPPPPSAAAKSEKPSDVARPKDDPANDPSAAPQQDQIPDTPEQMAAAGTIASPAPSNAAKTETEAAKEVRKPSAIRMMPAKPGGAHNPNDHPDDPSHGAGHKAKYPGPDATRDEYLAYLRQLTEERLATLPSELFAGRTGMMQFNLRLRPNGTVIWFTLIQPSGYADADRAVLQALNSIPEFPPVAQEFIERDGSVGPLDLKLPVQYLARLTTTR